MIKNFLIINCIGKQNKIGLKINNNFYTRNIDQNHNSNELIVKTILNLIEKHKINFDKNFSVLINNGPGSFSSIRTSLAVAKGIKISKNINLFGFKDTDLKQFTLANIELLIKKKLTQKNLIKPLYLS
jgi:tRNA A37 threonylcarbamoyladenosine modification protein TsaB